MKFPSFQKIALLTVGILAGNWVVDQFVIKKVDAQGRESGWVEVAEGFGQDDVVRSLVVAGIALLTGQLIR